MIDGVDVTVIAPAYARRAPRTLRNPASIDALAGSRLVLTVRTNAARIALDAVQSTEDEPQTTSLPDLATYAKAMGSGWPVSARAPGCSRSGPGSAR